MKDKRTDMQKLQDRHDGSEAFKSGISERANPHPAGSPAFTDWLLGYECASANGWK